MSTTTTAVVPFVLRQMDGVTVEVQETAIAMRKAAVEWAEVITEVSSPAHLEAAVDAQKDLAAIAKLVETNREQVKAPVLDLGRKIDATAKAFIAPVEVHRVRLNTLVTDYRSEVRKRELEEERKRAEEQHRANLERQRQEAEQRRREEDARKANLPPPAPVVAPPPVVVVEVVPPPAPKPAGLIEKDEWDFEVLDVRALAAARPDLVTITERRADILRAIRKDNVRDLPGVRIFSQLKTEVRL